MQTPSFYKEPHLDLIKDRSPITKLRAETQMEKDKKAKENEKSMAPSPATYKAAEAFDKTQLGSVQSVRIPKNTKLLKFTDLVVNQKKFVPPVGAYNVEHVLNHISRPKGYK